MTDNIAANIRLLPGVPEGLKTAFAAQSQVGDGSIKTSQLTDFFRRLDGDHWSEELTGQLIKAVSGRDDGHVRLDELLEWVFRVSRALEVQCKEEVRSPVSSEEPLSPKIERKSRKNLNVVTKSPWDSWEPGTGVAPRVLTGASEPLSPGIEPLSSGAGLPSLVEVDPTSPCQRRRNREKRARAHPANPGERLFVPESHQDGVLLLCPDMTFRYVHDSETRFSEGVQGTWVEEAGNKALLQPTSYGWCYEESFDPEEIIGVCHTVTLCDGKAQDGRYTCLLPEELLTWFSWLNPTLPEPEEAQA